MIKDESLKQISYTILETCMVLVCTNDYRHDTVYKDK